MNKPKYKAYDTEKGEWLTSENLIYNNGLWFENFRALEDYIELSVDDGTVQIIRFTGKQDGHQNDLYTGDIVTSTEYPFQDDGVYNYHGIVEWCDERAAFVIRKVLVNSKKSGDLGGASDYLAEYDLEMFEKLGNVYEHGDLLEKV